MTFKPPCMLHRVQRSSLTIIAHTLGRGGEPGDEAMYMCILTAERRYHCDTQTGEFTRLPPLSPSVNSKQPCMTTNVYSSTVHTQTTHIHVHVYTTHTRVHLHLYMYMYEHVYTHNHWSCRTTLYSVVLHSIIMCNEDVRTCTCIIGASVSEPPLVDSTDALSRYIDVCTFTATAHARRANVAGQIGNRFSRAESAFSACIGSGSSQTS